MSNIFNIKQELLDIFNEIDVYRQAVNDAKVLFAFNICDFTLCQVLCGILCR